MFTAYIPATWDSVKPHVFIDFKNFGHLNDGVMKATSFISPKHGAIAYLIKNELEGVAKYGQVEVK